MSTSNYNMTHINYKNLKERMSETSKGFWKVQSIHKLTTQLKMRYNPKDYIILKTIKKPPPKIPPFILFEHEVKKHKNLENQKNNSCGRLTVQNFFITGNEKIKEIKEKKDKEKTLFNKLYGNFSYEPYLYNEFQFFFLKREKRLLPRRFKDVLKDCIAFREYKNYLNNLQKIKDEKNMTQKELNNNESKINNKKSMTMICRRNYNDNEIINNIFGENKNDFSIISDNNNNDLNYSKILKENSSSSMKNIRNDGIKLKSKKIKIKKKKNLPSLFKRKKLKKND